MVAGDMGSVYDGLGVVVLWLFGSFLALYVLYIRANMIVQLSLQHIQTCCDMRTKFS